MLLGQARGKVGDLVFSRSNGQQVTRARAAVVKNPQTETQMIQRIILNTVAQAYSRMSAITDHSFEGIQAGQPSMSYFMSKNLNSLRSKLAEDIAEGYDLGSIYAFSPVSTNQYAANRYIIAKGTLPEVPATFGPQNVGRVVVAGSTYADIINAFGLQRGDQLTFVATQGASGANTTFHFARVILSPTNADGSEAPIDTPFLADGAINLPSPRNEGQFATLQWTDGNIDFNFSAKPISGVAVIVSRQSTNGTWLRSNATLEMDDTAVAGFQLSMQECLDMFAAGGVETLNNRYLNNSGASRLAGAGDGTFTVTDLTGAPVTIVSYEETEYNDQTLMEFTASDGRKLYVKNLMTSSRQYAMFLSHKDGYMSTAFASDGSPATTSSQIIPIYGIDGDNANALVGAGFARTVFVNNEGDGDQPSVTAVQYSTDNGSTWKNWPTGGDINGGAGVNCDIKITGQHLTESGYLRVTNSGTNQTLSGSATERTCSITDAGTKAITVAGYAYGGTVTTEADEP